MDGSPSGIRFPFCYYLSFVSITSRSRLQVEKSVVPSKILVFQHFNEGPANWPDFGSFGSSVKFLILNQVIDLTCSKFCRMYCKEKKELKKNRLKIWKGHCHICLFRDLVSYLLMVEKWGLRKYLYTKNS